MIPRDITAQAYFTSSHWRSVVNKVKERWEEGYSITDFDYGDDTYVVIMSKVSEWSDQTIKISKSFPTEEIQEGWDEGYSVTNMLYDGTDWIVVMTNVEYVVGQSVKTNFSYESLRRGLQDGWDEDMMVTKLCSQLTRSLDKMVVVMSEFFDCSQDQSLHLLRGDVTPNEIGNAFSGDKFVTDLYDFGSGLMVVASSNTEWDSMIITCSATVDGMVEKIDEKWQDDYFVTTVAYYNGYWYVVYGTK